MKSMRLINLTCQSIKDYNLDKIAFQTYPKYQMVMHPQLIQNKIMVFTL